MKRPTTWLLAVLILFCGPLAAAPRMVASIKPVHSLLAGVTEGVADPVLLLDADASPHGMALRPSAARALAGAELVVMVCESLETALVGAVERLAGGARVIELARTPGLRVHPLRAWSGDPHGEEHVGEHGHAAAPQEGAADPHLWLDPHNALVIVAHLSAVLARHDPANAQRYARNGASVSDRLRALDEELAGLLAPLAGRPYVVFHDAFQYLEFRYGLRPVAVIAPNPERGYGARRVLEIQALLRGEGVTCLFREPQFEPRLVTRLVSDTGVAAGVLDPLGAGLAPGAALYFDLLRANAQELRRCLGAGRTG